MSDDEILVLLASLALTAWFGGRWYWHLATPSLAKYPGSWRRWLAVAPFAWLIGVFIVLKTAASFDVREAWQYIFFYLVLGAVWIVCSAQMPTACWPRRMSSARAGRRLRACSSPVMRSSQR